MGLHKHAYPKPRKQFTVLKDMEEIFTNHVHYNRRGLSSKIFKRLLQLNGIKSIIPIETWTQAFLLHYSQNCHILWITILCLDLSEKLRHHRK